MGLVRREFLLLLGGGLTGLALAGRHGEGLAAQGNQAGPGPLPFQPVATSLPQANDGLSAAAQRQRYRVVRISDKLELPKGYSQQLIASWGEPVGNSRFGYNNDYLALRILNPQQALLSVNFEYISALPWRQAFAAVVGKPLPYQAVVDGLKTSGGKLDASQLPSNDPRRGPIQELAKEALIDQGLGDPPQAPGRRGLAEGPWPRGPANHRPGRPQRPQPTAPQQRPGGGGVPKTPAPGLQRWPRG